MHGATRHACKKSPKGVQRAISSDFAKQRSTISLKSPESPSTEEISSSCCLIIVLLDLS
jgi:hypothetical protein